MKSKQIQTQWLDLFVVFLATLCVAYSWMSPEVSSPNERSRLYLSHAIQDRGSIMIDEEVDRWGMVFDIANANEHFYTDKAPGSSILALPVVALSRKTDSIEKLVLRVRHWTMVPITFFGGLFFILLLQNIGISANIRRITTVGLLVGTSVLHYGGAIFGHVIVMTATIAALFSLSKAIQTKSLHKQILWGLFAGLAAGSAFAVEYQAVGLSLMLGFGMLLSAETRKARLIFPAMFGAILIALPVLAYNNAAFGSPFSTSYAHLFHQHSIDIHSEGIGGITHPHMEAIKGLIFSRSRGLLFGAPLVFFGFFGLPTLWQRSRWIAGTTIGLILWFLYIGTSIPIWYGGWGFGPRLLIPMFGVSAIAAAALLERYPNTRPIGVVIVFSGIIYNIAVSSIFPELPESISSPMLSIAAPLASKGGFSPNIGTVLGLENALSIFPLFLLALSLAFWTISQLFIKNNSKISSSAFMSGGIILLAWWLLIWLLPETANQGEIDWFVNWAPNLRAEALP